MRPLDPRIKPHKPPRTVQKERSDEIPVELTDKTPPRPALPADVPTVEPEARAQHNQHDEVPPVDVGQDQYGGFVRNRLEDCPRQGDVQDVLEWAIPVACNWDAIAPSADDAEEHVQAVEPVDVQNEVPAQPMLHDARPHRIKQPNSKYSPDVYDLSYVGSRTRSRKSIRRARN